jgi:hypothetical protein
MGLIDLLKGRKKVFSGSVDFSTVENIIEEAGSRGVDDFDVTLCLGPKAQKKHEDYEDLKEVLKEFKPHEFSTPKGEWVYRQEMEGVHQEYAGKDKEVHYIYLKNILYGGTYRLTDGGKKPHRTGHYVKIRFETPRKTINGAAIAAIIGIVGGLLFFSSNLTGNVVGYLNTTNFIGIILLLVGIVGAFIYLRNR